MSGGAVLACCGFLGVLLIALVGLGGIHKIPEGHIGIYFRGGAIIKGTSEPGYHTLIPVLTTVSQINVVIQTDKVTNIPCGTSGGVVITFDKVEVVNQLRRDLAWDTVKNYTENYDKTWIFDKIHHEINQFCSKHTLAEVYIQKFDTLDEALVKALQADCNVWAPGIRIISIRVTKPNIPENIRKNYEQMEAEKTKYMIAVQAQQVARKEAETAQLREKIAAQTAQDVAVISMEQKLLEQQNKLKITEIENDMKIARVKAEADAWFYEQSKMIEANENMLTGEYLMNEAIQALKNQTKNYFGENLNEFLKENLILDWSKIVEE